MPEIKNYDAKQVSVVVAGRSLTGLADGTFVTAERTNDMYVVSTGADGTHTRSKSSDRSGVIVITLKQTSEDNAFLNGLAIADELSGSSTVPAMIRDSQGTLVINSADCWFQKTAGVELGKEAGDRVWTLQCAELDIIGGGN